MRPKQTFLGALLFALSTALLAHIALCAQAPTAAPAAPLDPRTVDLRADAWAKSFADAGDFSGVLLIAQGDKILVQRAYGKADPQLGTPNRLETRFRAASISKTFTAAAVEILLAQGKLRLTDTLGQFVTGVPKGDSNTVGQLLLHESGVGVIEGGDAARNCLPHDELLARLRAAKPLFLPGKQSQYSNEGYFLLSLVVERASGESLEDVLRKNIFVPLHMADSGLACRDLPAGRNAFGSVANSDEGGPIPLPFNEAAEPGAGTVYATAKDLLSWLKAIDTNPQFQNVKWKYPYGWGARNYSGKYLIEQSGQLEGFNSHVALYPAEHIYVVVLSNIQSGFSTRIPKDLEAVLFGGTPSKPPVVQALTLGERSMKQYEGSFRSSANPYTQTLANHEGHLAMHWNDYPFWRTITMVEGDTFFARCDYAYIRFARNKDGLVASMTWSWPSGGSLTFDKLDVGPPPPISE
jgi:CubicO group peptidase (beta-lactamase class C family)